ncbi:cytochrome P450 [Lactarius psammicola]|nr:cytochrome P450 [Lactarius psammicola]
MLTAGGDTTSSTLLWWLFTMLAYPEVQNLAHAEIDEAVGSARPSDFADLPSLLYIRAMVKETLRWSLTVPFGVPHASSTDDWYEGMFIPKGTICLQNMRLIKSEPDVSGTDVERFNPAIYLDENRQVKVLDGMEKGCMSFGRRICPRRYVAEGTLVIDIATLLWAMRFERPEGVQAELDVRTTSNGSVTAYVVFAIQGVQIADIVHTRQRSRSLSLLRRTQTRSSSSPPSLSTMVYHPPPSQRHKVGATRNPHPL